MLRRAVLIVSLFVLLSDITTTQAEDTHAWTAWLHYGRHMTLVNSAGESLREVDLPLPENNSIVNYWSDSIILSRAGDLAAYFTTSNIGEVPSYQLVVASTVNDTLLITYDLPKTATLLVLENQMEFNEDGNLLAIGYRRLNQGWQIDVIQVSTGQVIYSLDSNNFHELNASGKWTPVVQKFDGTEITFTLWSSEKGQDSFSFIWNPVIQSIDEDIAYQGLNADTFWSTGEVLLGMHDSRIAGFGFNTLQIYDPITHSRYPFYAESGGAYFVENGRRVLLTQNGSDQSDETWKLLERNGVISDEWEVPENIYIYSIKHTPNGFLYTSASRNPNDKQSIITLPALIAVNTRDDKLDAGQTIWHLSFQEYAKRAGGNNVPLEIVWEHDDMPPSAYKPWAQLAPPVYEPTPTTPENLPPPTMIPTPEPLFQVGMTVRVQTTGGEILNLRRDHTRKADVIMYLENKMILTLLEGPVENEGFTWWRVRTADGVEGWTVENNGDLQTLMPANS